MTKHTGPMTTLRGEASQIPTEPSPSGETGMSDDHITHSTRTQNGTGMVCQSPLRSSTRVKPAEEQYYSTTNFAPPSSLNLFRRGKTYLGPKNREQFPR